MKLFNTTSKNFFRHRKTLFIDLDGTLADFYEIFRDADGKVKTGKAYEDALNVALTTPGFFEGLNPHQNIVDAIKIIANRNTSKNSVDVSNAGFLRRLMLRIQERWLTLIRKNRINLCVLSAADGERVCSEKTRWIKKYLPCLLEEKRLICVFPYINSNKALYLREHYGFSIDKDCFLLDDYSKNCVQWELFGGTAIKVQNEINRKRPEHTFEGEVIVNTDDAHKIAKEILRIMGV